MKQFIIYIILLIVFVTSVFKIIDFLNLYDLIERNIYVLLGFGFVSGWLLVSLSIYISKKI